MEIQRRLNNLLGIFWGTAAVGIFVFFFTLIILAIILKEGDSSIWPIWAKIVIFIPMSITGLSAFFMLMVLIVQLIRSDSFYD